MDEPVETLARLGEATHRKEVTLGVPTGLPGPKPIGVDSWGCIADALLTQAACVVQHVGVLDENARRTPERFDF